MTFLPACGRFDPDSTFGYLGRHAIPGVEVVDPVERTLTRLIPRFGDQGEIGIRPAPDGVEVRLLESDREPTPGLLSLVRLWFDLDADLGAIADVLDHDPALGAAGRLFPALRIVGFPDGFEATITTVLGQQVSLAAMRTFAGRLAGAYGRPSPGGSTEFPSPARLAAMPTDRLRTAVGVTGARARTLHSVAALFADGFTLDPAGSIETTRATLLAVPGIGPWTVDYLAMRVLHDTDACPAGDLVLRRALGAERATEVLARAEGWRPYRAYGVMRLWTIALATDGHRRPAPRAPRPDSVRP